MTLRNERVRKELMRDISDIFRKEVRGLEGVVSIVDVEVSHDNSYAKVYYSVLGSPEQVEKRKADSERLRDLQRRAKEARNLSKNKDSEILLQLKKNL